MEPAASNLVRGGFYLFVDLVIGSLAGWGFWLVISKLTTPSEIGLATTAVSLVGLIAAFFGLGLEFPLLREISGARAAFGTLLAFELLVLALLAPILYVSGVAIYGASFTPYMALGIGLLLLSGLDLVTRYSALGLLQSRTVMIYDTVGSAVRFGVGVALVLLGLGGIGILSAAIVQGAVIAAALFLLVYSRLGFQYGGRIELVRLLKMGLSNLPGRAAGLVMGSLSIVLLAAVTANPAAVGLFFIALAFSSVAAGFARSLATMALPVSGALQADASTLSLRLGLAITTPLLTGFVAAPGFVLALVGPAYVAASEVLRILAIGALPLIVLGNVITRLNHVRRLRPLITLGAIQLAAFLVLFALLTPRLHEVGAALAILLSAAGASIYALPWVSRESFRSIGVAALALAAGWGMAVLAGPLPPFALFLGALALGLLIVVGTRELTLRQAGALVRLLIRGG